MEKPLAPAEIGPKLKSLEKWSLNSAGKTISKNYSFDSFGAAMIFVNKVAWLADKADHHPDILVSYNKVTLTLSTHSAGGLTSKDFALAHQIDQ